MQAAPAPLMAPRSEAWPSLVACHQRLHDAGLADNELVAGMRDSWAQHGCAARIVPGQTVAIAAGSRGIDRIHLAIRTVVELVREAGGEPFIFPAMGSHGGATAEGQRALLAGLGIDEARMGCPVRATMEVVTLGDSSSGVPVYLDAHAAGADHIVVVNRIKEHTNFHGEVESGLCKMLAIGAGKHAQAIALHLRGTDGLRRHIPAVARTVIAKAPVLGGFALIEDAHHRLCHAAFVPADQLPGAETELLTASKQHAPRLPVDDIDLLIVDEIGKNISGTGMDTNVIGRCRLLDFHAFPTPRVRALVTLGLTPETHGNAIGVGMADLIPQRMADEIDRRTTAVNCITGLSPAMAALPIVLADDREVIRTALDYFCGPVHPHEARVVRIRNTLDLSQLWLSPNLIAEAAAHEHVTCDTDATPLTFSPAGDLLPQPQPETTS